MRKHLLLLVGALVLAGCGTSSGDHRYAGRWKAEPNDKGKPYFEMMVLDLREDGTYTLLIDGYPVTGRYTMEEKIISLNPERAFGQTQADVDSFLRSSTLPEEYKNMQPLLDRMFMTMFLSPTSDGKALEAPDDVLGTLVFRQPDLMEDFEKKVATEQERALVGDWEGAMNVAEDPSKGSKEAGMVSELTSHLVLELRADKTFRLPFIKDGSGTWSVDKDVLTLTPAPKEGKGKEGMPLRFKVSDDNASLQGLGDEANASLSFTRHG